MLTERDRRRVNWLAVRVTPTGAIAPGHEHEAAEIAAVAREVRARRLPFRPGVLLPPSSAADCPPAPRGRLACHTCGVLYGVTQYHCCACRRVFVSSAAFERHQQLDEGATPEQLGRLNLVRGETGAWVVGAGRAG